MTKEPRPQREDLTDTIRHRGDRERSACLTLIQCRVHLVYQLFFDGEGKVIGDEVLHRWDHPLLGALSREIPIRVAEECGLIDQLGQLVLNTLGAGQGLSFRGGFTSYQGRGPHVPLAAENP